jgi:hypothetical protein
MGILFIEKRRDTMYVARGRWLLFIGLLSLVPFIPAAPVGAIQPTMVTNPIDETDVIEDECPFDVNVQAEGFIKVKIFTDQAGTVVREIDSYHLKETYTNPNTGRSVSTRNAGPDILTFEDDGAVTVMSIGLIGRITVPGQGLVTADVGRIVLFFTGPEDEEPDVLFEAGQHEGLFPALCDVLGPA